MSTLDDWLRETTAALKLPTDAIPADLRNDLLDLTREVAHNVARIAGPLTCYLLGMAAAQGVAPSAAVDTIRQLALAHAALDTAALDTPANAALDTPALNTPANAALDAAAPAAAPTDGVAE